MKLPSWRALALIFAAIACVAVLVTTTIVDNARDDRARAIEAQMSAEADLLKIEQERDTWRTLAHDPGGTSVLRAEECSRDVPTIGKGVELARRHLKAGNYPHVETILRELEDQLVIVAENCGLDIP